MQRMRWIIKNFDLSTEDWNLSLKSNNSINWCGSDTVFHCSVYPLAGFSIRLMSNTKYQFAQNDSRKFSQKIKQLYKESKIAGSDKTFKAIPTNAAKKKFYL